MRSANMQALTNDLAKRYPGMTIYGIGDAAHQLEPSDHNEDDTPGSNPAQSDGDDKPEHRAIDGMISGPFTAAEATALVKRMVLDRASQQRLYYIIWNRTIWSRSNGWAPVVYTGDNPHTDHVHWSGIAYDDENAASWPIVAGASPTPGPKVPWPSYIPTTEYFGLITGPNESHGGYYANERPAIKMIQQRLIVMGFVPGISDPNSSWADGLFEQPTKNAVAAWQRKLYSSLTSRYGEIWTDDWERLFTY